MITIVDYGMGNLGSILNMFKHIGVKASTTCSPEEIRKAEKLILPGVGAFDAAMARIQDTGLLDILKQKVLIDRIPILGICLGMQLLTRGSEEGVLPGLGWIPADTKRFPSKPGLKVPHMGWNIAIPSVQSSITKNLPTDCRFYFVHSYYVSADNPEHIILRSTYDTKFAAAIQRDNIYGAQFHPEKSHKFGMQLLKNFAEL
jgi:imidazole glycerol-phosphate synthase subunit HisH